MKIKKLAIVATVAGLGTLAFAEDPFPKGWSPDLDEVTDHIRAELKDAQAQQTMNRLIGRLAEVRDAQLALVYLQLWQKLPAKEQAALKAEQAAWIKKRDRSAEEEFDSYKPGTYAPSAYAEEFIKWTDLRIKELQARLNQRAKKIGGVL